MSTPPRLVAAQWFVNCRRFSVIPLEPRGKKPVAKWTAFQFGRPGDDNLTSWFGDPDRDLNLGIVTGSISQIVVVDLDNLETIAWAETHLPLTEMKTRTARGQHWFYRHPGGTVRNAARVRTDDVQLAIDVRGDGGFVVGPPSIHETGVPYTRLGCWPRVEQLPVFDPTWLVSEPLSKSMDLDPAAAEPPASTKRVTDRQFVLQRAARYLASVPPAIQGDAGDPQTFRACCKLVRGFDLTDAEAFELLASWNTQCVPPWTDDELLEKIQNARKYGDEPIGGRRDTPLPGPPPVDEHARPAGEPEPDPDRAVGCPVCGRDSCEDPSHQPPPFDRERQTRPTPPIALYPAETLLESASLVEVVEGLAWQESISVLASESGAGKSFLLLDLAAAVAAGVPWHGRYTLQGSVVYLAYEGALRLRLLALRHIAGRTLAHLFIGEPRDPLSPRMLRDGEQSSTGELAVRGALETLRTELAAAQQPPVVLLIVDTVRASLSGSEDNSEPVSAYLRVIRRLMAQLPGAAAILSHHAGWQDGDNARKRERGSSAWRGNADTTLYLETAPYDREKGEAELTLRTLKVREGEDPPPLRLLRQRVDLHQVDRHGRPVTSCIIQRDTRSADDVAADRVHAEEHAQRQTDLQLLRFIQQHTRLAGSKESIRTGIGLRRSAVYESVARLLQLEWIEPPARQRGSAYTVSALGRTVLEENPS